MMMASPLQNALFFLVSTILNLYIFILIIRAICFYTGLTTISPFTQFISKTTSKLVLPLKRFIPDVKSFECATLVLILICDLAKIIILSLLQNIIPALPSLLMLAIYDSLYLLIMTFFYAILIQGVLSFIQPMHPYGWSLNRFTSPVVSPFRRFSPTIGVIDLAPFIALLVLQLILILFIRPILNNGGHIFI